MDIAYIITIIAVTAAALGLGKSIIDFRTIRAKRKIAILEEEKKLLNEEISRLKKASKSSEQQDEDEFSYIRNCEKEINIQGVNCLKILLECREFLIQFLSAGGNVKLLLLDINSKAFKKLEKDEEVAKKKFSGRLRAEYNTSLAVCRDILNFSKNKGKMKIRIHEKYPTESLVIIDPSSENAKILLRVYPQGKYRQDFKDFLKVVDSSSAKFITWFNFFNELWNKSKELKLI